MIIEKNIVRNYEVLSVEESERYHDKVHLVLGTPKINRTHCFNCDSLFTFRQSVTSIQVCTNAFVPKYSKKLVCSECADAINLLMKSELKMMIGE